MSVIGKYKTIISGKPIYWSDYTLIHLLNLMPAKPSKRFWDRSLPLYYIAFSSNNTL